MNTQEYILKAVKLVGWKTRESGSIIHGLGGYFGNINDQVVIDALSVEIVRQAEASGEYEVDVSSNVAEVFDKHSKGVACTLGDDRVMNAIKVVVDSGILA